MPVLFNSLTGTATTGGSWSFISGPMGAPSPPVDYDDDVDFSSAPDGTYVYRYTVTVGDCTTMSEVTVIVGSVNNAQNDDCTVATNITTHFTFATTAIPSGTTVLNSAELWTQGCEKDIATLSDDSPWSLATSDIWYKVPLPILSPAQDYNVGVQVTSAFFLNGLLQPSLALYTGNDCDNLTLIDQSESSTSSVSLVAFITGSPTFLYIRVGARGTNEGLFDIIITT